MTTTGKIIFRVLGVIMLAAVFNFNPVLGISVAAMATYFIQNYDVDVEINPLKGDKEYKVLSILVLASLVYTGFALYAGQL